jgi:hypothetical protein
MRRRVIVDDNDLYLAALGARRSQQLAHQFPGFFPESIIDDYDRDLW